MRWSLAALVLFGSTAWAQRPITAERQGAAAVKRIGQLDRKGPRLNAVIALTPDWRAQARAIDRRAVKGPLLRQMVAMIVQPTTGPAYPINPVQGDKGEGPSASQLPAMAGYPHLTVPMAQIQGLPVGLSFIGPKWSEAALLAAGAAFEAQRGPLPGPSYRATVPVG